MKREDKKPAADTLKTTIRVRRDLWNAIMHRSIDENRSLQAIVEDALQLYLKREECRK